MNKADKALQKEVEKAAFFCSTIHIGTYVFIAFGMTFFVAYPHYGITWNQIWDTPAGVAIVITTASLEIIAAVLLFMGAKVKNRFLIFPCMLLMILYNLLLELTAVVALLYSVIYVIILIIHGHFPGLCLYVAAISVVLLIVTYCKKVYVLHERMYISTAKFYAKQKVRRNRISRQYTETHRAAVIDHTSSRSFDVPALHVNLPDRNDSIILPSVLNESPPQRNDTPSTPNFSPVSYTHLTLPPILLV